MFAFYWWTPTQYKYYLRSEALTFNSGAREGDYTGKAMFLMNKSRTLGIQYIENKLHIQAPRVYRFPFHNCNSSIGERIIIFWKD